MKILLTATVQSHICQFHRPLVDILHEQGYEVHVAARDNLAEKNGLKLDFADKVFNIPFSRSPKSADNIKAYKQLKKIINDEKYDIIHCNTPMGGIVTRLAAIKARKNGTKVFYTAHGFHFYKGASKKNWLVFYPIEKFFSRLTDTLITITNEDYELASKKFHCNVFRIHGVGGNTKKFFIMSDEEKTNIRKELGYPENTKLILNVGELLPNKNQKNAIKAMTLITKKYPDSKLLIAGNGRELDNYKALISELSLENNIKLLGYTTELFKYMNICDVLLACSYREGLPLNLIEAMLCGKAIVASVNRGHKELIDPGKNGFLVEPDDIAAYSEKVITILENPEFFSAAAKEFVIPFTDYKVREELKILYGINKGK